MFTKDVPIFMNRKDFWNYIVKTIYDIFNSVTNYQFYEKIVLLSIYSECSLFFTSTIKAISLV